MNVHKTFRRGRGHLQGIQFTSCIEGVITDCFFLLIDIYSPFPICENRTGCLKLRFLKKISRLRFIRASTPTLVSKSNTSLEIPTLLFSCSNEHPELTLHIVMLCAIWYNLYSLKNVKNTHGGVLLLLTSFRCFYR